MSYFPEPYTRSIKKVELALSNYAAKFELKRATSVDTSNLAKKADLASWKPNVDELISLIN